MTDEFRLRATLAAPPSSVYSALTDPSALRIWLASDVSIDEDNFEFWGRFTPQGDRGHQRLLASSPDRGLTFSWLLDDIDTTVDIKLAEAGSGTELTLTHSPMPTLDELMSPPGRRDGRHTMHTFWPLVIGNLNEHLAGRSLMPSVDFSPSRPAEIRVSLTINAPASRVFASITDPMTVERWWGAAPEIEPRVGGKITFGAEGHITEWSPNKAFAYTEAPMVTRWELSESDGSTTLTFVQSGFSPTELDNAAQHEAGWLGGLLELKRMHELGSDWKPVTSEFPE
jgi:uncharacterized protein YndB with AHSA1/START domain